MKEISIKMMIDNNEAEIKTGPFGTQLKASEYTDTGTPVLNVKNLGYAKVVKDKLDHVGDNTLNRLSMHILKTGDIVFGRKGAVDRHAYITVNEDGWMQGSDCIRLRIVSESYNPKYLSYFFMTNRHKRFMEMMCSHGTTMASLNQKVLERICFPCPERYRQDTIVEILECLDKRISINERINDNLSQLAQLYFGAWFKDNSIDTLAKVPLSEATASIIRGKTTKYVDFSNLINLNQKVNKGSMLEKQYYKYLDPSISIPAEKYAQKKDILLNSLGFGTLGRIHFYNEETTNVVVDQHITIIRFLEEVSTPEYLYLLLTSDDYSNYFESCVTGSTGMQMLNISAVRDTPIPLPGIELQENLSRIVRPLYEMISRNTNENESLANIRDTLLPKLMSGELDVSKLDL